MHSFFLFRSFLLALCAVSIGHAAKTKAKVLILGGGLSGLQAAYSLKQRGIDDILLLEADTKLGGRFIAGNLPNVRTDAAFWEADTVHPERNTLVRMANLCNIPFSDGGLSNIVYIDDKGNDVSAQAAQRRAALVSVLGDLTDDWINGDIDGTRRFLAKACRPLFIRLTICLSDDDVLSIDAGLNLRGWHETTPVERAVENWYFEGLVPYEQSLTYYLKLFAGSNAHSANQRWFNPDISVPFTSQKLIDCMRDLVFEIADERVQLNALVDNIAYDSNGVTVTTDKGIVYQGEYAIVTFSIGVLQRQGITFSPPLPFKKQLAINEFVSHPLTYVFVRFNSTIRFNSQQYLYYIFALPKRLEWLWCRRLPHADLAGSQDVCRFWLVGEEALRVESQPLEDTFREVADLMKVAIGVEPASVSVTSVNQNPLFHGGFRLWPPSLSFAEFDTLREPLMNKVFFAGEGYQLPLYGRAAAISGNETANVLADCISGRSCAYEKFGKKETVCGTLEIGS